jgi:hypothetical protein
MILIDYHFTIVIDGISFAIPTLGLYGPPIAAAAITIFGNRWYGTRHDRPNASRDTLPKPRRASRK